MKLLLTGGGDGDKKPKPAQKIAVKKPFDWGGEMKAAYKNKLKYDNNTPANEIILAAAKEGKIDPSELIASSWVEGLNKAVADPERVSEAYNNALTKNPNLAQYPVDAFHNYGLDTFGDNYAALQKYLPANFKQGQNFEYFDALNEQNQPIKTIATKTNKDALIAKAAFMNMEKDNLRELAKKKGVQLDDKALRYLTFASFNGGPGRGRQMLDEYVKAKDRNAYIDKGQTSLGQIHKNITSRMGLYDLAQKLFSQTPSPSPIPTMPQTSILNVR